MGVGRNFSSGDNVDISLILFQVEDDAMQMDLCKTLYPFYQRSRGPGAGHFRWNRSCFQTLAGAGDGG